MIEIVPAILERSLEAIEERLYTVRGATRNVQIDVVDGRFAQSLTWPFADALGKEEFGRLVSEEEGLPLWEDFDFEADLMLEHPARDITAWRSVGCSRLVVHAESSGAREALEELQDSRGEGTAYPVLLGVALSSSSSPDDFAPFEALCDFVQVMGIEKVGFQGQAFDERAVMLVSQLRSRHDELTIQVDGGVTREHVSALARAGASRLIVGSAIFGIPEPKKALEELRRLANSS